MEREAHKGNIIALEYETKEAEKAADVAQETYFQVRSEAINALRSRQDFIDAREQGFLCAEDEDLNVATVLKLEGMKEALVEARRAYVLAAQTAQEFRIKLDYARRKHAKARGEMHDTAESGEEK